VVAPAAGAGGRGYARRFTRLKERDVVGPGRWRSGSRGPAGLAARPPGEVAELLVRRGLGDIDRDAVEAVLQAPFAERVLGLLAGDGDDDGGGVGDPSVGELVAGADIDDVGVFHEAV